MTQWVCRACYEMVMQPVWQRGGEAEIKTVAPFPGTACNLPGCANDAVHLLVMPTA